MDKSQAKSLFNGSAQHFVNLQKTACFCAESRKIAESKNLIIKKTQNASGANEFYIHPLEHAARQYRVCENFSKIVFKETANITPKTSGYYSNFVRLMLAISAYEQYCNIFDKKWHELSDQVFCDPFEKHVQLREILSNSPARKIRRSLSKKLQEGWDAFVQCETNSVIRPMMALRHAVAHGEIWGGEQLLDLAFDLPNYCLDSIEAHCTATTEAIKNGKQIG